MLVRDYGLALSGAERSGEEDRRAARDFGKPPRFVARDLTPERAEGSAEGRAEYARRTTREQFGAGRPVTIVRDGRVFLLHKNGREVYRGRAG